MAEYGYSRYLFSSEKTTIVAVIVVVNLDPVYRSHFPRDSINVLLIISCDRTFPCSTIQVFPALYTCVRVINIFIVRSHRMHEIDLNCFVTLFILSSTDKKYD